MYLIKFVMIFKIKILIQNKFYLCFREKKTVEFKKKNHGIIFYYLII